jgi:hypothetical protein
VATKNDATESDQDDCAEQARRELRGDNERVQKPLRMRKKWLSPDQKEDMKKIDCEGRFADLLDDPRHALAAAGERGDQQDDRDYLKPGRGLGEDHVNIEDLRTRERDAQNNKGPNKFHAMMNDPRVEDARSPAE